MNKPTVKQVQNAFFGLMVVAPFLAATATFIDSHSVAKPLAATAVLFGAVSALMYQRLGKVIEDQQKQAKNAADALQANAAKEEAARLAEYNRRCQLLATLRQHYLMSHDGISPGMMSGLEPMPKGWVERQLASMGETWRQDVYR